MGRASTGGSVAGSTGSAATAQATGASASGAAQTAASAGAMSAGSTGSTATGSGAQTASGFAGGGSGFAGGAAAGTHRREYVKECAIWLEERSSDGPQMKKIYDLTRADDYKQAVIDYLAGMTDNYANKCYNELLEC